MEENTKINLSIVFDLLQSRNDVIYLLRNQLRQVRLRVLHSSDDVIHVWELDVRQIHTSTELIDYVLQRCDDAIDVGGQVGEHVGFRSLNLVDDSLDFFWEVQVVQHGLYLCFDLLLQIVNEVPIQETSVAKAGSEERKRTLTKQILRTVHVHVHIQNLVIRLRL